MELIKYAGVSVKCAIVNKTDNKPTSKLQLYWIDDTCWNKQCLQALDKKTGRYPKNENEIMLSSEALRNIGKKTDGGHEYQYDIFSIIRQLL